MANEVSCCQKDGAFMIPVIILHGALGRWGLIRPHNCSQVCYTMVQVVTHHLHCGPCPVAVLSQVLPLTGPVQAGAVECGFGR